MQKIKMVVSGKVQGVGFRYTTLLTAKKCDIKGKVWNNNDGTVGILAQSDNPFMLTEFEKQVRDGFGHKFLRVDYVDVTTDHSPDFSNFEITH